MVLDVASFRIYKILLTRGETREEGDYEGRMEEIKSCIVDGHKGRGRRRGRRFFARFGG